MRTRLHRIVAVLLIVLGVLPFTAPFLTYDLVAAINRHQLPAGTDSPESGGVFVKAATDPDEGPVLAADPAQCEPLFGLVLDPPAAAPASLSIVPRSRQVLRV